LPVDCEACKGASGADLVALAGEVAVEGVVTEEEEVEPDDEPDCEVEGELEPAGAVEPAGAPLAGGERSLPVWEASPVCGRPVEAADSGAVVVAALTDAQYTIAPPASTSASTIRARLLTSAPRALGVPQSRPATLAADSSLVW
jgi:hypothetical protein